MRMPFMYRLMDKNEYDFPFATDRWVVVVGMWSYSAEDTRWMKDEIIGDGALVPAIDIVEENHYFDSEEDAVNFIKNWWVNNG